MSETSSANIVRQPPKGTSFAELLPELNAGVSFPEAS